MSNTGNSKVLVCILDGLKRKLSNRNVGIVDEPDKMRFLLHIDRKEIKVTYIALLALHTDYQKKTDPRNRHKQGVIGYVVDTVALAVEKTMENPDIEFKL